MYQTACTVPRFYHGPNQIPRRVPSLPIPEGAPTRYPLLRGHPMPTNRRERGKSFQRDRPMGERRKNVGGGPRRTLPHTTTPMPTNWRERGKSFQRDQPIRERGKNLFPATVHSARTRVYSCSIRDMQFCVSLV
jgi:hypothetical protein